MVAIRNEQDSQARDLSDLRPTTEVLLIYLQHRAGETVSKSDLMDALWPDTSVTENSLYQSVSELRRALQDNPDLELKTVPRRGYRLVRKQGPSSAAPAWRWPVVWPDWRLARVAMATVLLSAVVAARTWTGGEGDAEGRLAGTSPEPAAGAMTEVMPAVVVHPFTTAGSDPTWELFGQSLSGEVAGALAANKWLRVHAPGRAGTARFGLNGSLLAQDGRLQVQASLTERTSGALVWSKTWEGEENAFFDLQAAVAHGAAAELGGHWSGAVVRFDARKVLRRPTDNLDAYALFLRATQAKHRFTPESFEEAHVLLDQAVILDPGFVDAWTTLSVVHNLRALTELDVDKLEHIVAKRAVAVETAIALTPEDPTVLMEQGWLQARRGDHVAARMSVRRAAAQAPDNPDILAYAALNGNLRVDLGADGVSWTDRALGLNPDPPPWYFIGAGLARFTARDWQGAVEAFDRAPAYVTRDLFSAVALAQMGKTSDAQAAADRLMKAYPGFRISHYVYQEGMQMDVNGQLLIDRGVELGLQRGAYFSPQPANAAASSD